jgi:PAS domain S-box-containing protein
MIADPRQPAPSLGSEQQEARDPCQRVVRAAVYLLQASVGTLAFLGGDRKAVVVSVDAEERRPLPLNELLDAWEDDGRFGLMDAMIIHDARREGEGELADLMHDAEAVALVLVPLRDDQGEHVGALAVADLAPRRWTPEEVQALRELGALAIGIQRLTAGEARPAPAPEVDETLARLRRSFDDALAGHAVAAPDGRILACNPEFVRIAGFDSVEAAMSANLYSLEPEPGAFKPLVERLREAHLIPLEELHFVRRDGRPARVLARLAATVDGQGWVTEVRVYLVDITHRFELEQELRAGSERLHLVELATQDVLWDWDLQTGRVSWNGAVARRFRFTPEEVQPSIAWHLERIHPDDRERVLNGVERAILGVEDTWSDEYRFLRGDDSYATVLDRAHVVRNGRGEPVRVVGSILDITERKASEDAHRFLARASADLEEELEVSAVARTLADLGVPALADFCLVDIVEPGGSIERLAVAHVEPRQESLLGLGARVSPEVDPQASAPMAAIRSGAPDFLAGCPVEVARRLGVSQGPACKPTWSFPSARADPCWAR